MIFTISRYISLSCSILYAIRQLKRNRMLPGIYLFECHITPSFSISSVEDRIPAVSAKTTGYPLKSIHVSTTSLVVPGTLETIAASRLPAKQKDAKCSYRFSGNKIVYKSLSCATHYAIQINNFISIMSSFI